MKVIQVVEDTEIIKRVVETGEVKMGSKSVSKTITSGKLKLVIVSSNCPKLMKESIAHNAGVAKIPVYSYKGTSLELGEVCRKPFPISAMAIVAPGDASLTQLVKEAKA